MRREWSMEKLLKLWKWTESTDWKLFADGKLKIGSLWASLTSKIWTEFMRNFVLVPVKINALQKDPKFFGRQVKKSHHMSLTTAEFRHLKTMFVKAHVFMVCTVHMLCSLELKMCRCKMIAFLRTFWYTGFPENTFFGARWQ